MGEGELLVQVTSCAKNHIVLKLRIYLLCKLLSKLAIVMLSSLTQIIHRRIHMCITDINGDTMLEFVSASLL